MIGTFDPVYSTNNIWWDENMNECLTPRIEGIESDITALETGKANATHTHSDYAVINHAHSEYADTNHTHSEYVAVVEGKGLSTNDYTADEKTKLAGIAAGANKYSLPTATSSVLGGVKTGSNITNSSGVISISSSNVTSALGFTPQSNTAIIPKTRGGAGRDMSDFPANSIIRNSGSGGSDLYYTATANGACYATSANGYPTFGTLPVAQGGTGQTTKYTNGTVTSVNNTTITSSQFCVYNYLNKAFIRLNILTTSAVAADGAMFVALPSTIPTAHSGLACYNEFGYDIHCGVSSVAGKGVYIINCGTSSMPSGTRLYITGWYSI